MSTKAFYQDLLDIFRTANGKTGDVISTEIERCSIPLNLKTALMAAVQGDNRELNDLLFSRESDVTCLAWIAPTKQNKYVWMVGHENQTSIRVHKWFSNARKQLSSDPLLKQEQITPSLLFVDTHEISRTGTDVMGYEDEFAIFQVGYKDSPIEVSDLEQRMIINTSLATRKRLEALSRLTSITEFDRDNEDCFRDSAEVFAVLHNEGHNQGHFVGAWPFDEHAKKASLIYEAVEEFKACLSTIVMAEHLPLSDLQRDLYATSVFITRFLCFGFEAFCLRSQRRETAREIAVGLMFFEWLQKKEAITLLTNGKIALQVDRIRKTLIDAYRKINDAEEAIADRNLDELSILALEWYGFAFPDGEYSQNALSVYNCLRRA